MCHFFLPHFPLSTYSQPGYFNQHTPGLGSQTAVALSRGRDGLDCSLHSKYTGRDPLALAHFFINFNFHHPMRLFPRIFLEAFAGEKRF